MFLVIQFLLFIVGESVSDSANSYIDDCQYYSDYATCGHKCVNLWKKNCECGDTELTYKDIFYDGKHCCMDQPVTGECNGRCYNEYSSSKYLGYSTANFFCSGLLEQCVKVVDLCRGVSWCPDDVQICNNQLRCAQHSTDISLATMKNHTFCNYTIHFNDGAYENIDRSDESFEMQFGNIESDKINFSTMTKCKDRYGNIVGLNCGDHCLEYGKWCLNTKTNIRHNCGKFYSDNTLLCKNASFWKSVPCTDYYGNYGDDDYDGLLREGLKKC